MKVKVAHLSPTLCDPMDCSPWNSPGQNTGRRDLGCHCLVHCLMVRVRKGGHRVTLAESAHGLEVEGIETHQVSCYGPTFLASFTANSFNVNGNCCYHYPQEGVARGQ